VPSVIRPAFLDAAETAARLLRDPALAERWSTPSALPDFSTSGLACHLAYQITATADLLAAAPGHTAIPVLEHFTGNAWLTASTDSEDNVGIRRRNESAAASTTPTDLAATVEAALTDLRTTVPAQPPERIVDLGDWGLKTDDFLLTRVLELVVHTDDLAVSLGVPTPPIPPKAAEATIALLTSLATWRHGSLNVIRALARHERAPASIAAL
jgi:uncharacterized protein (TIGR03083 family)